MTKTGVICHFQKNLFWVQILVTKKKMEIRTTLEIFLAFPNLPLPIYTAKMRVPQRNSQLILCFPPKAFATQDNGTP